MVKTGDSAQQLSDNKIVHASKGPERDLSIGSRPHLSGSLIVGVDGHGALFLGGVG